MSNLTIDQILREYDETVKTASVSPSFDETSDEEVEKMATLLKQASVPNFVEKKNLAEKIAEARVLTATYDFLQEEGSKLASFREDALQRGFSPSEVDDFIEKKASAGFIRRLVSSPVTKGLAGAGLISGSATLGFKKGKEKGDTEKKDVANAAFKAGRIVENARARQYLQAMLSQQKGN